MIIRMIIIKMLIDEGFYRYMMIMTLITMMMIHHNPDHHQNHHRWRVLEIYVAGGSDRLSQAVRLARHDYSFTTFIIIIIIIMLIIMKIMKIIITKIIYFILSGCQTCPAWLFICPFHHHHHHHHCHHVDHRHQDYDDIIITILSGCHEIWAHFHFLMNFL